MADSPLAYFDCVEFRGRRRLALAASVAVAIVAISCAHSNAGDPGHRRLKAIRSDPAFQLMAPGTKPAREGTVSASEVAFTNSWLGPSAYRTLSVEGSLAEVLAFYDERVPTLGWEKIANAPFADHDTRTYRKDFGGWNATLAVQTSPDEEQTLILSITAPPATEGSSG